jgi:hypothetical protein
VVVRAADPDVGATFEIVGRYQTESETSDGSSSGSSRGSNALLERVIAVRDGGVELEYDLPADSMAQDRAREWMLPARIFRPASGASVLVNADELEARVDPWLKKANWTRAICGRWIFSWNAFKIDCDPQSVLATIASYQFAATNPQDGAAISIEGALRPGTLSLKSSGPKGQIFAAELELDPDAVRRARAESDVVVGEIMGKPVSFDDALAVRAKEEVAGTVTLKLETDAAGMVLRETTITRTTTTPPGGPTETETATRTLERRRVTPPPLDPRTSA